MLNPTSHSNVATASHMPCKIFPNEFQGRRTEKGLVHLGTPFEAFWSHHTELDMNVAHLFSDWSDCLSFYLIVTVGEGGGREGCQGFGWWKGGSQWLNDSMTLHISQLFIRSISVPRFVLPVSPNHLVATFAFNEPWSGREEGQYHDCIWDNSTYSSHVDWIFIIIYPPCTV